MKIAFIINIFPTLSETFILNQITGLIDMGHDITILASSNPHREKIHPDIEKYKLMERSYLMPSNKIWRILKCFFLIIANLHKEPAVILRSLNVFRYGRKTLPLIYFVIHFLDKKFDIIHCHFGPNGNLGAHLKELGIQGKLVTTFHGYDIRLGLKKGGKIYRKLFKFGNYLLASSDYARRNLIKFGADPKKIISHPVGIDINRFPFKWHSDFLKDQKLIVILTIARLSEEKGLEYGIQAISKLLKKDPKLHLKYYIIGGGPLENKLKKQIRELNLDKTVHLLGPMVQEEVIKNMVQAHIFILPSLIETFGVVLLEAQAVGLPVIATDVGSVAHAISNEESGFLIPERDVDALTEKIEYLIKRPELWPNMGRAGREYVEREYNIKKLNKKLVRIYENLIESNS